MQATEGAKNERSDGIFRNTESNIGIHWGARSCDYCAQFIGAVFNAQVAAVNNDKLRLNNIKYLPYCELFLI